MADRAVRLAEGVWRIPTAPFSIVNSFALVEDDGSVTLVDTGLKRAPARIARGLAAIGRAPADVRRIVLTHAHMDHAGGVAQVARGGAEVAVHEDDAGYVREGRGAPVDTSTTTGRLMARTPEQRFEPVEVGQELREGDLLPIAGGLRVVHTPGHTPGHVALLHEPSRVLITGDSIFNVLGRRWPPGYACTDFRQNRETARRLLDLDFGTAAFTHGEEIRAGARDAVATFLRGR